jgi:hypothetical protein
MVSFGEARVVAETGFVVTGTAGADRDGFVEWISWQQARVPLTSGAPANSVTNRDGSYVQAGVELGQHSSQQRVEGALRQQLINHYNASMNRSNSFSQQVNDLRREMEILAWRHNSSTDPQGRAIYAAQYQRKSQTSNQLVELWKAEVRFQMTLRPGYQPTFR